MTANHAGIIVISSPVMIFDASNTSIGKEITGGWSSTTTQVVATKGTNGTVRSGNITTINDIDLTNVIHIDGSFTFGGIGGASSIMVIDNTGSVVKSASSILDTSDLVGFYKIGYSLAANGYSSTGMGSCSINNIRVYTTG